MDYKINWDCSGGVFAVPDAVADKGLKLASGKALKVLIYFMKNRALPDAPEDIGVTEEDVEDALSYWEQMGVLQKSGETEKPVIKERDRQPIRMISTAPAPVPQAAKPVIKPQKSLLPTEITARIDSSEEIRFLFQSAEGSLKRALTFDDQRSILWFYDHLGMSADIIIMLIAFCCSVGYTNMGRIEKIALDWHDKNICTHEQAESEILSMQKVFSFEGMVQSRLRLQSKLTASQKKYIGEWCVMDMSLDMVELAYDRTVDSIGKPSFNYMNKIIVKWYENGVKDTAAAELFDDRPTSSRKKKSPSGNASGPSYDLDALFEHAMNSTPTVKRSKEAR